MIRMIMEISTIVTMRSCELSGSALHRLSRNVGKEFPWTFPTQALVSIGSALLARLRSSLNPDLRTTFILGDPTLRFAQVKPVSSLTLQSVAAMLFVMVGSGTSGAGYWIYA